MAARPALRNSFTLALLVAALAAGCGDSSETEDQQPITLKPPTTPLPADCGLTGAGKQADAEQPPDPGTYRYRTSGRRVFVGEGKRVTRLPAETKMIVSKSLKKGGQSCFALQRAYESDLGDTGVFVINGNDTYLRSGQFQVGADITEFTPNPSALVISGSELEWDGAFRGQTSGRYEANVIGRKRIRVGGRTVKTIGISLRVDYRGDIQGFEESERWISLDKGVVVQESEKLERAYGLDLMRLNYKSRLISLDPAQ